MIIGVKYWALGASVPGSWTDVDCLACYVRPSWENFDSETALDGTKFGAKRKYYKATLEFDPLAYNHGTYGPVIQALLDAQYISIKDTRRSYLGDTNTVVFVCQSSVEPSREQPTNALEGVTIELISQSVI